MKTVFSIYHSSLQFDRVNSSPQMSVTLSGLLALENRQTVDGLPLSLAFDGQMWLADERSLRGSLRYYNATKESLPDMGTFFAWIHVRLQSFQNKTCLTISGR